MIYYQSDTSFSGLSSYFCLGFSIVKIYHLASLPMLFQAREEVELLWDMLRGPRLPGMRRSWVVVGEVVANFLCDSAHHQQF